MADEIGNMKAMLEALEWLHHDIERQAALDGEMSTDNAVRIGAIREALAAPPRNCDVGTAEKQAERFEDFCLKHIGCAEETGGRHCLCCPLVKASEKITQKCELYWAQMPYEEGGAE